MSGVSRPVASLPTAWFCPECGHVEDSPPLSRTDRTVGQMWSTFHYLDRDGRYYPCNVAMVEIPCVPPGASVRSILALIPAEHAREGWMTLFDDGSFFASNGSAMGADDIRVVVVLPEGEVASDAS